MQKSKSVIVLSLLLVTLMLAAVLVSGCGNKGNKTVDPTGGRPESVTAYEAVEFARPAAKKWQSDNWMIEVRSGDPDGIDRNGKAKIWEVYFFSPTPEEDSRLFVIYNRGNVWPNAPGMSKGGEEGLKTYRKGKPSSFRVDSPEACEVARRNGGNEFKDKHPDARAGVILRCKADYDAVGEKMPAPKYKWIWDVNFSEPTPAADELHVLIDAMTGDFITSETKAPPR
ncbi:MAG: hypothetical protein CVT63_03985 [Candidatus Anoxymicrobium japonicum]|uniref:Lipoprotein n=1 Tax=Candidatus Anoxymicrobium japonicum TaxID=2013648 RepID=A0A2N3G680_9ACTN|nr:MAG: hypothetical protein CVT63_03985 [Candidatus Anoxymicrobium japonicum]